MPYPRLEKLKARFWEKVAKSDGCWLWTAHRNARGYGTIAVGRIKHGAHRVSYELANGRIADGLFVLHRCDTPACVRPDHLFLGTNADNMRDMHAKGRHRGGVNKRGEAHPRAKLSAEKVRWIRWCGAAGYRPADMANLLRVQPKAVRDVLSGRTWSHA